MVVAYGLDPVVYAHNAFPVGINEDDPTRWVSPEKYSFVEHAERNAIYHMARAGLPTLGCRMFSTAPPCVDCARAIIQAGFIEFYYLEDNAFADRFDDPRYMIRKALALLQEANVYVEVVK